MKLVILDRDGVINFDSPDYIKSPGEWRPVPGSLEAIALLAQNGWRVVVATNQSGIGRGIYADKDCREFNDWLKNDVGEAGVVFQGFYYCPHHPTQGMGKLKKDCDCRKPKPGLIFQAESAHGPFDFGNSWAIGDKPRDLEMAKKASDKIRTILVPKNFGVAAEESIAQAEFADYQASDFLEAVNIIMRV